MHGGVTQWDTPCPEIITFRVIKDSFTLSNTNNKKANIIIGLYLMFLEQYPLSNPPKQKTKTHTKQKKHCGRQS